MDVNFRGQLKVARKDPSDEVFFLVENLIPPAAPAERGATNRTQAILPLKGRS
jgi:DNA gyrase/topoisomerase IV subunit B